MELSFEAFLEDPLQIEPYPVVLLASKESYDIRCAIEAIQAAGFFLKRAALEQLEQELSEPTFFEMFGENEFLWFQNIEEISKKQTAVLQHYTAVKRTRNILLSGDASTEIIAFVKQQGLTVKALCLKPWDLQPKVEKWIINRLKTLSVSCGHGVAAFLAREYGSNRDLIAQELEKLSLFCHGREVTMQDIHELVVSSAKKPMYELHDALLLRDRKRIILLLSGLIEEGLHPLQITRYLRNQFHQDLMRQGLYQKRAQLVAQAGEPLILALMLAIDVLEVQLKSQVQDERLAIELQLLDAISTDTCMIS